MRALIHSKAPSGVGQKYEQSFGLTIHIREAHLRRLLKATRVPGEWAKWARSTG
jgi:hypothetical protein